MPAVTTSLQAGKRTWVKIPRHASSSKVRLFCFPYAGGRSQVFREWVNAFSTGIEVCPVHLPGENIREPCLTAVDELVPMLAEGLRAYFDKPFAFFGHSMGAIIAFELLRFMQRNHGPRAAHLFVSARSAPGVPNTNKPLHDLPEPELIAELKLLNGTPREILDNADVLDLLLPRIRADFQLNETYSYLPGEVLDCGITAYCGTEDSHVLPEEMLTWRNQTSDAFTLNLLPGDHFFLQTQQAELLASISGSLAMDLARAE